MRKIHIACLALVTTAACSISAQAQSTSVDQVFGPAPARQQASSPQAVTPAGHVMAGQQYQQQVMWGRPCPERGLFQSDWAFADFIEPVSNPILFEDPRSMTRLRFDFINQTIPEDSILGGGDLQVYAMQATVALTERLTFIANRDGYIELQADALPNTEGWGDLGTGFKYSLIRDPESQFLLTAGFLYEWTQGSEDVFQGNGDGVWNFFLTTGKEFGRNHFIGTIGWELPNSRLESESLFYSLHLDHQLTDELYLLAEFTGIQYLRSGNALPGVNVEGGDLINLGAGNVAGNHFASAAVGAVYKFSQNVSIGATYEVPVTGREDLMDDRVTANLSLFY